MVEERPLLGPSTADRLNRNVHKTNSINNNKHNDRNTIQTILITPDGHVVKNEKIAINVPRNPTSQILQSLTTHRKVVIKKI